MPNGLIAEDSLRVDRSLVEEFADRDVAAESVQR